MYIPFSFFGGTCLNSGSTFYYYNNTTATTDNFSYPTLCNSAISINESLTASQSIEICTATTPSGINATTVLVDVNWNVSASCDILYAKTYRISATSVPTGNNKNVWWSYSSDAAGIDTDVVTGTGTANVDVISYCRPQINNWSSCTIPTITDLGPTNNAFYPNKSANLFKNKIAKIINFESGNASGSATYQYLDAGNNFKTFTYTNNVFNQPRQLVYELVTNTIPFKSAGTGSFWFLRDGNLAVGENTTVSSSCYNYDLYSQCGNTINYVGCDNISASVILAPAESITICARANSIVVPTIASNCTLRVEINSTTPTC